MLVEMLAVELWRFYYVDRLMELALRHPDPKVVACRVFTLARHYDDASRNFLKAARLLNELPTGTNHRFFPASGGQPECAYPQTPPENPPLRRRPPRGP